MHVMALSTISNGSAYWDAMKAAYGRLPHGAEWVLAVASADGTRAVNVIAGVPVDGVRRFFDQHAGPFAATECFEVDAANAVGLPGPASPAQAPEAPRPDDHGGGARRHRPTGVGPSPRTGGPLGPAGIEARVSELLAAYRVPSAQIGVLRDGRATAFAVGVKDVRTGEPATVDTVYQLGSMSKTWTALAFLQLVDEGRVALDEPVRTYLPGFRVADPEVSARLTPRQLLNHTNGIEEAYGDPGEGDDVYERMVAGIAAAPQVFPLGHTHGYSAALGYAILARIMEVLDRARWDRVMRDRLFGPLGLTSTTSWRGDVDPARAATGHIVRSLAEGPVPAPVAHLPRAFGPGGTISSTVGEVLAMSHVVLHEGRAADGRRLVSAASVREMTQSRVAIPDPYPFGPWWGLGLIVGDWNGATVYAHDGSTIGQSARLRILPDEGLAVAMLTNGAPSDGLYRAVFNEILAGLGAPTVPDLPAPDLGLRLDAATYVGRYERPGSRFEVEASGGRLQLTLVRDAWQARVSGRPERTTHDLLPIDGTHFLVPPADPLEDPQTVAIYDVRDGAAHYLHTNARVHPRVAAAGR